MKEAKFLQKWSAKRMGAPSKWKIHIMQIWPRDGEVWGKGGWVANRAYMMNIGHGDSNSSGGGHRNTGSDREGGLQDKVVFCVSCVKLMEGFVKKTNAKQHGKHM